MQPIPDHSDPVERLRAIVAVLRGPGGCPWDQEQDHQSLRASLLEEAYEVLGAIERADDTHLCEELGDLLLQVVMHARLAEERGRFDLAQVAEGVADKLVRRHPHVFGNATAPDSSTVLLQWEAIKQTEKGVGISRIAGVEPALPALAHAQKLQRKAARHGFDWDDVSGAIAKLREEMEEWCEAIGSGDASRIEEEAGDWLFASVNVIRKLGLDAELVLRKASAKFERRFRAIEALATARGLDWDQLGLEGLDHLWDNVKRDEGGGG